MSYNTKVYHKQPGDELVVASGGTITVESGGTATVAGIINVTGTLNATTFQIGGTAFKFKGGTATIGSGSAVISTGLTTVTGFTANVYGTASPGTLTSILTPVFGSAGTVTVYGWKVTNSSTTTLIATDEAAVISYTAIGT